MTKFLMGLFAGLIAGGLLGALVALWAWTDASDSYHMRRTYPRYTPEIMADIDPCLGFRRTGGYEPDPCDRPRGTIPEPGTLALMLAGAIGVIIYRKRVS